MDNSVTNLNDGQYEALKQFKRNVSDILTPDHKDAILIKWLRARNYNLKKAEALFRGVCASRQVYEFDDILNTYVKPEVAEKYEYTSFLGFAKDGSVVRYNAIGKGDHMGFIMSMTGYEIGLYCSLLMEEDIRRQRKENDRTGRDVHEITYIFDMDGFAIQDCLYKSVIETGIDLARIVQEHYPEVWGNIFFVNAPMYFDKAFNIFKPIMRLNLLQKIRVVSRESTGNLLRKYIDDDVLPAFLGGKKLDSQGNPMCSEFIKFGGKIPEQYYGRNRSPLQPTDPGVTSVWVAARSVFNYALVVRKANSTIRVEMRTENGSISFKMLYRPFGNDPEILDLPACDEYLDENDQKCNVRYASPACRLQAHLVPINDTCKAPWPGIYIFQCDNTYSWFTSRRVIFRIKAIPPE